MITPPKHLQEIRAELQREIYDGKLMGSEVYMKDFMAWYQWRLETQPYEDGGIPLEEFDVDSVGRIFEEWVKQHPK